MRQFMSRLASEEDGATMVEYALMVALIAAVCIVAATAIGTQTSSAFTKVSEKIVAP